VIYFFLWHQRTPDYLFQGDMLFGRMLTVVWRWKGVLHVLPLGPGRSLFYLPSGGSSLLHPPDEHRRDEASQASRREINAPARNAHGGEDEED
jgi:hypothetical protein